MRQSGVNILSVGGSDPSGISGLQRDARIAWSMGYHPLGVTTAVTAQNTSGFTGVQPVDTQMIRQQLDAVLSDFDIAAVKVGMLWSGGIMRVVADSIRTLDCPVVLDPVIRSTTGGMLVEDSARYALLHDVVPLANVVTPNAFEAGYLTGTEVTDVDGAGGAARSICQRGASAAVVTGIQSGDTVHDVLYDGQLRVMKGRRLEGGHRGGGCTFSAAVACRMAAGHDAAAAVSLARETARAAVSGSVSLGAGRRAAADMPGPELAAAVDDLAAVRSIARMIPQCQTNFVHAPPGAVSPDQVLGIRGRLVRTGDSVVRAGVIAVGGSKHVASAVCAARARFPGLRSAVNIRYSPEILAAMVRVGFVVLFYDRDREPDSVRESGSSVAWGVSEATAAADEMPDAICHRGDFGKEPMTLIFGETPGEVVSKIRRISQGMRQ